MIGHGAELNCGQFLQQTLSENAASFGTHQLFDARCRGTILADVLAQDLASCGNAAVLNLTPFHQLSARRQRQLLSAWMKGEDLYRPALIWCNACLMK